ncbi:MAG: D-glycero-alpha-D-manno-heptose-1,7-bisphosphate 7-phosphatase [Hyphomicrobiales bacterium]
MNKKLNIDSKWTLFLDRDGVINRRLPGQYVRTWDEFEFLPQVLDAIEIFTSIFHRIFIVTNQQGIGKELMTEQDLEKVHNSMLSEISNKGGRIDKIYFCPALAKDNHPDRKPSTGMIMKAAEDFKDIDLSKSIMVGDSLSDMKLAKNANIHSVFLTTDLDYPQEAIDIADMQFTSLIELANYLKE